MEVWELLRVLTADEFLGLPSLPSNVISGWFFFFHLTLLTEFLEGELDLLLRMESTVVDS